jgi:hypothetical protein
VTILIFPKRNSKIIFLFYILLFVTTLFSLLPVAPSFGASIEQTPQELASTYAPILRFTSKELFYPTSVEYIINSSVLRQRSSNGSSIIIDSNPEPDTLGSYTSTDLFLDNKLGSFENISADYALNAQPKGYYAYVHIVNDGPWTVIQYWFFYAYNNGPLNDHQGDLEVVQVFLDTSDNPQIVLLSQHFSGQNAYWKDVEKQGTHPVVYVAQGSHANFFRSYQGKIGIESDVVGSDGLTINYDEFNLTFLGEKNNHPPEQSWLDFAGRWGYWGTVQEVALGRAGPFGPVFNQDDIRWTWPQTYLSQTFLVTNNYLILAWISANLLLIFIVYTAIMSIWKIVGIVKLKRKMNGLLVGRFLKGRGGVGIALGLIAILIIVLALPMAWYNINASSQAGPLAGEDNVNLMNINGIEGLQINLFLGGEGESTSGYRSLLSTQIPFAIIIAAGLILLLFDIIGVKSGKKIGRKFIFGAITSLLPFIIIVIFMMQLPVFLPWAEQLLQGQGIPVEVDQMIKTIAANPITGTTSQDFPVVGTTTVRWGFGIGAYLFLIAAGIRVIAGAIMLSSVPLQKESTVSLPSPKEEPSTKKELKK